MKIKLAEWASIAEIIGSVAIVISLIFVGFQISDGNRATRAATTQAILESTMYFQAELTRHPETWVKVIQNGDFSDEVETQRAKSLFNMLMTLHENRFQMRSSELLMGFTERSLRQTVISPFFEIWRESPGAASRSEDFLNYVDNLRAEGLSE
jgi:hypothetical protein